MRIAITGATGNLGKAVLKELLELDFVETINLLGHTKKKIDKLLKENRKHKSRIHVIMGSLNDEETIRKLIDGMDIVINSAGVIPPQSDIDPKAAIEANVL